MTLARRLPTVLLGVFGGAVVLVFLVFAALQTPWGRDYVRRLAERQASSALGADVSIAGLRGSLIWGASLDGLAVTQAGQEVMSAEQVSARYDAFDFLRGAFVLDEIVIDRPVVRTSALGRLGREEPQDAQASRFALSIGRIEVHDGTVHVGEDLQEVGGVEMPDVLRDVQAELSLEIAADRTHVAVRHLSFAGKAPDLTLERLSGVVLLDGPDLVLENIAIQLAESSMTVSGTIDNFRNLGGSDAAAGGERPGGAVADADWP